MKKVLIFVLMCFTLFSNKVYANMYDLSFTTSANKTLKTGDVIELKAGIGCIAEDYTIDSHKFLLLFDKDVFDLVFFNDDTPYIMREGWEFKKKGVSPGSLDVELVSSSPEKNITFADASGNCKDSVNAVLLTYKLKVKTTENKDTKVQVVDEANYVEEIKFTVHNNSSNNYLASLTVEDYELDSDFNKIRNEYEVYVPYDVVKVNVNATTEDTKANLSGTGEKQLAVGDNKVELVVTAENGTKNTYTVNIIRKEANDDTTLSKVVVTDSNKDRVSLAYDDKKKTFTGDVSSEITFVSFDIKCSGDECLVEELKPESLQEGRNEFKFKVVSQNGEKEEYKIVINKAEHKKDNTVLYLVIALGISVLLSVVLLILYIKARKQ